MSVYKHDRRLQMYITSRTKIIPDDAADYTETGSKANQCVFCNAQNAKRPVVSSGVDTFTLMCSFCHDQVQKEFDSGTDASHVWKKQRKKDQLLQSLQPNMSFTIPEGIERYFTHLNGSKKDVFAADNPERCYICDSLPNYPQPYTDVEEYGTILIPVRQKKLIHGGRVHICNDKFCAETALEYNKKLVNLQIYNEHSKEYDALVSVCPICRTSHLIVDANMEILYRSEKGEFYDWQCPACAYTMLNRWETDQDLQQYFPAAIGEPRDMLLPRYSSVQCTICNTHIVVDLMITEFSFFSNHLFNSKLICRQCSLLRTWLELPTVYKVMNTAMYIEIYPNNMFSIFRVKEGQLEPVITNGNTGANNMIDTLFIAHDETLKFLGNDIDLWK